MVYKNLEKKTIGTSISTFKFGLPREVDSNPSVTTYELPRRHVAVTMVTFWSVFAVVIFLYYPPTAYVPEDSNWMNII